jgi:serine protease Do
MRAKCLRLAAIICCLAVFLWKPLKGEGPPAQLASSPRQTEPFTGTAADADAPPAADEAAKTPEPGRPPTARPGRRGSRGDSVNEKNHATVKAAFRGVVSQATAATARILAGGEEAALAAVVDADGYLVSKASLLEGELVCRLSDGRELEAKVVGVSEEHDLALLKVDARDLTSVPWRIGDVPPPGTIVAAIAPPDTLMAIGVVSAEPRSIRGSARTELPQGSLGVALGADDSGLVITRVYDGSAAKEAGLKVGDRIKNIDGTAMTSAAQAYRTVGSRPVGASITLVIQRDKEELELVATLGRHYPGRSPYDYWGGGPFSRRREGFPAVLVHDTVVHPHNCGGPLVDTDGNVLGINIARALRVATYAVPADVVRDVIEDLRKADAQSGRVE